MVYSIIIGSYLERSRSYVIVALDPELFCLESLGKITGACFVVYSVIIVSEPELSCLSVIVALDPEMSCLGYQDVESRLPRRFGDTDLGFL